MANINPTRVELKKLKERLKTAVNGHKLLKDKNDELIHQFMLYIRENKALREEVERKLTEVFSAFVFARAAASEAEINEALMTPSFELSLAAGHKNIMGVNTPVFGLDINHKPESEDGGFPYSFITSTAELDNAAYILRNLTEKLLKLAEIEKTCNMLSLEIERTRRRVNALEYEMIPKMKANIKFIAMKLAENERGNIIRLLKVKEMIENRHNEGEKGV